MDQIAKKDKSIEGIRAVAILLVIAAHAGIPGFEAGFIGVDIFFVISGFLITRLLMKEILEKGSINFSNFYIRRLQRLLPALIVVIIITGAVLNYILPKHDQLTHMGAGASASVWVSNIYFAFSTINYFGTDASANAFTHTWSLGVEEQFYLIWPALMILLWLYKRSLNNLALLLSGVAAISFLSCMYLSTFAPLKAFYLMPLRVWQFALGGLVFFLLKNTNKGNSLWGYAGLTLLLFALIAIDKNQTYPSLFAVLPTVATALIIYACLNSTPFILKKYLSAQFMQILGKTSYSWYLWHWPVLIIGKNLFVSESVITNTSLCIFSWMLAFLTFKIIESPIRYSSLLQSKPFWKLTIFFFIMLLTCLSFIRWHNKAALNVMNYNELTSATHSLPIIYKMGCDQWYKSSEVKPCYFGNPDASKTALLLGDSIGAQWFPAIEKAFINHGWRLIVLTKSACPMIDGTLFYKTIGRDYTECEKWKNEVINKLAELSPDLIILGSARGYALSPTEWQKRSENFLKKIVASTTKLYIIRPTPELPFNGPQCLYNGKSDCTNKNDSPIDDETWSTVIEASKISPKIFPIDLNEAVCPQNLCSARNSEFIIYRDQKHLTASFVLSLHPLLEEYFKYELSSPDNF
jgi:peptidoglycan/LPS O-acetylase OafA/YrhL